MRTFRVLKDIPNEYITTGEEYFLVAISSNEIVYKKVSNGSGSFMRPSKFKEALRNSSIVFTD